MTKRNNRGTRLLITMAFVAAVSLPGLAAGFPLSDSTDASRVTSCVELPFEPQPGCSRALVCTSCQFGYRAGAVGFCQATINVCPDPPTRGGDDGPDPPTFGFGIGGDEGPDPPAGN